MTPSGLEMKDEQKKTLCHYLSSFIIYKLVTSILTQYIKSGALFIEVFVLANNRGKKI